MYREVKKGSADVAALWKLWNGCVGAPDFAYKALTMEEIGECFLDGVRMREKRTGGYEDPRQPQPEGVRKVTLIHDSGDAFVSGSYIEGEDRAFITMVLVAAEKRGRGLGQSMLAALELELCARFPVKELDILYFNPVNLVWEIPGHPGCEHPNSPGVDMDAPAYPFFVACGYEKYAKQNSYFMRLDGYEPAPDIHEARRRLKNRGYAFRAYDPRTMRGMPEMVGRLRNTMWDAAILGEKAPEDGGRPILVPEKDGDVCGFAGPLDVERSGRGYFAGLAVDEASRGGGVAKVLFSELCFGLRELGAGYMTLFTGENNPARRIYETAGFIVVKSWANMKKQIFPNCTASIGDWKEN